MDRGWRFAGALLASLTLTAQGATVTIVSWNIYGYQDAGSAENAALIRVIEGLNPDILLLQEANNASGRNEFLTQFAARYPHQYLGPPTSDNPRNQIVSAFPLSNIHVIYTADPNGGTFERPTIRADVDILPLEAGTELRVYAAHLKSGSEARDGILRLNQATDDANDIIAFLTSNPSGRVIYAGDLNCQLGDAPLNQLLESQTLLTRLSIYNPNNSSPITRWPSGRIIDHVLYSPALAGAFTNQMVFYSETYPSGTLPEPILADDSETASDHLVLFYRIEIPEAPPAGDVRINEVYADPSGTDYEEFIELAGTPGGSLDGLSVVIIEGDAESNPGTVDRRWDLNGYTFSATGLFVLGDTAVTRKDFDLGGSNRIENGTQTILLVRGTTLAVGQDIDSNDDGIAEGTAGTIEDRLALADAGIGTSDRIYYGAPQAGPASTPMCAGVARSADFVGNWVQLSSTADGADGFKRPSPGLPNLPGDFDRDGEVDLVDFAVFLHAHGQAGVPTTDPRTDLDGDGDTDQEDFGRFQVQLSDY